MNVYGTVRIHAGLYISGDGRYKIRRVKNHLLRRWDWHVFVMDEGQWVFDKSFRTLTVARQYTAQRVDFNSLLF